MVNSRFSILTDEESDSLELLAIERGALKRSPSEPQLDQRPKTFFQRAGDLVKRCLCRFMATLLRLDPQNPNL